MNPPVSKVREAKLEFYRKKGKIHAKQGNRTDFA